MNLEFNIQLLSLIHHTNLTHFAFSNLKKSPLLDLQVANIELYLNAEEKSQ